MKPNKTKLGNFLIDSALRAVAVDPLLRPRVTDLRRAVEAPSGALGLAPRHSALRAMLGAYLTLASPGLTSVAGLGGAVLTTSETCKFCRQPGHRVDQCPKVTYVPGKSGEILPWCLCWSCDSPGHKKQDCPTPSVPPINGEAPTATAAVEGRTV